MSDVGESADDVEPRPDEVAAARRGALAEVMPRSMYGLWGSVDELKQKRPSAPTAEERYEHDIMHPDGRGNGPTARCG